MQHVSELLAVLPVRQTESHEQPAEQITRLAQCGGRHREAHQGAFPRL